MNKIKCEWIFNRNFCFITFHQLIVKKHSSMILFNGLHNNYLKKNLMRITINERDKKLTN